MLVSPRRCNPAVRRHKNYDATLLKVSLHKLSPLTRSEDVPESSPSQVSTSVERALVVILESVGSRILCLHSCVEIAALCVQIRREGLFPL
jgi:hypothetical protein